MAEIIATPRIKCGIKKALLHRADFRIDTVVKRQSAVCMIRHALKQRLNLVGISVQIFVQHPLLCRIPGAVLAAVLSLGANDAALRKRDEVQLIQRKARDQIHGLLNAVQIAVNGAAAVVANQAHAFSGALIALLLE